MENEMGIISYPLCLYLSHSHHRCFAPFSNPNSIYLTITNARAITQHHQQISNSLFSLLFLSALFLSSLGVCFLFLFRGLVYVLTPLGRGGLRFEFLSSIFKSL